MFKLKLFLFYLVIKQRAQFPLKLQTMKSSYQKITIGVMQIRTNLKSGYFVGFDFSNFYINFIRYRLYWVDFGLSYGLYFLYNLFSLFKLRSKVKKLVYLMYLPLYARCHKGSISTMLKLFDQTESYPLDRPKHVSLSASYIRFYFSCCLMFCIEHN